MTRQDIIAAIRRRIASHPQSSFTERTVDAPEVELVVEIGQARREASARMCPVCICFECYQGDWHARTVVQVGWHHLGKGEDRKSRPDCIGTPWERLLRSEQLDKAIDFALGWLPTANTPSSAP